jgi:hypothetical protein
MNQVAATAPIRKVPNAGGAIRPQVLPTPTWFDEVKKRDPKEHNEYAASHPQVKYYALVFG